MRSRFEVFAAVSLTLHAGAFAAAFAHARRGQIPETSGAGGTPGAGAAAAVGGETFEVPDLEEPEEAPAGSEASPLEIDEPGSVAPPSGTESAPPRELRKRRAGGVARGAAEARPSEPRPLYGAVGDRSAGDLVATFKRVFPIAASSDPLWERVPVGFFADGDVTFFLAEDGSLTHTTASAAAAPAFRAAIARTTRLLEHRLFTAHGATTRLHMVVRVTGTLVNHGAFTIDAAGSFELPSGRHVSVSITER